MDKGATDGARKRTPDSSMRVILIEISERHEKLVLVKLVHPVTHRTSDMYTQFYTILEWILYLYSRVEVKDRSSLLGTIAKQRLRKIRPNNTTPMAVMSITFKLSGLLKNKRSY